MATRGVILTCAVVAVEVILSYAVLTRGAIQVKPIHYNTVYALTFAGLNFRGFRGSAAIRENLDLFGNESPFVR